MYHKIMERNVGHKRQSWKREHWRGKYDIESTEVTPKTVEKLRKGNPYNALSSDYGNRERVFEF